MGVTVLSYQARLRIAEQLESRARIPDIAEELYVSDSTIYSEIARGGGAYNREQRKYVGYNPDTGQAAVSGPTRKYRRFG